MTASSGAAPNIRWKNCARDWCKRRQHRGALARCQPLTDFISADRYSSRWISWPSPNTICIRVCRQAYRKCNSYQGMPSGIPKVRFVSGYAVRHTERAIRIRVCLQAYRKHRAMNAPLGAGTSPPAVNAILVHAETKLRWRLLGIRLIAVGRARRRRALYFCRLLRGTYSPGAVVALFLHVIILGQRRDQGRAPGELADAVED